jgi:hypothetical protein
VTIVRRLEGSPLQPAGVWTFFAAELANIKPGVEAWIAAQRLNRLAQVL